MIASLSLTARSLHLKVLGSGAATMAAVVLAVILLVMAVHSSGAWCVCKEGLTEAMLQKTLDYACGAGADCGPIHQNGPCFNPNTVKSHCSYAVNSLFQKKGQSQGTCDFCGTATLSASDPSYATCSFPASASGSGCGTTAPVTTTPSTGGGLIISSGGTNPDLSFGFKLENQRFGFEVFFTFFLPFYMGLAN